MYTKLYILPQKKLKTKKIGKTITAPVFWFAQKPRWWFNFFFFFLNISYLNKSWFGLENDSREIESMRCVTCVSRRFDERALARGGR